MRVLSFVFFLLFGSVLLNGCATTQKTTTDIPTQKFSKSLQYAPKEEINKSIYVQIRNRSTDPELNLEADLKKALRAKGYRIVTVPDKAHFLLEAEIVALTQDDAQNLLGALQADYGAASPDTRHAVNPEKQQHFGLLSAKKSYQLLADVRISELSKEAVLEIKPGASQPSKSVVDAYFSNISHWSRAQTRLFINIAPSRVDYPLIRTKIAHHFANALAEIFSA